MIKLENKRNGNRTKGVAHCDRCGKLLDLEHDDYTVFYPNSRGTAAYMCEHCMEVESYFAKNDIIRWGTDNLNGFTYGFEFEIIPASPASHALLISRDFRMLATYDGSLPIGGIEFKTPVYDSLHGVKQIFRTVENNQVVNEETDRCCGTHIHIGHTDRYTPFARNIIKNNIVQLVKPLGEYLKAHEEECINVFGRYFTFYANFNDCTTYLDHQSWININLTNIEFRLPKMITAEQYFYCVCMVKEMFDTMLHFAEIIDCRLDGVAMAQAQKKLIKIFKKYADGKANCQRPERNTNKGRK